MRNLISIIVGFFRKFDVRKFKLSKKNAIITLVVLAVIVGGTVIGWKYLKPKPKHIYEALIAVRSQNNPDPKEDEKTSLKAGDVILALAEGHNWSLTEKVSYLILKMNLTEDQARTLVEPEQKTVKEEVPSGPDGKKEKRDRQEILRARRYRINLEKLDKNFDPNSLLERQPYFDKVYDWSLVEKKPRVK